MLSTQCWGREEPRPLRLAPLAAATRSRDDEPGRSIGVSQERIQHEHAAPRRPALDEDSALRLLFEGTAKVTGKDFFHSLVKSLAAALGTHGAWVTEYDPSTRTLKALAFYLDGRFMPWESKIDGTPCEKVIDGDRLVLFPDRVLELYPNEPDFAAVGAVSYMGVPLKDVDESILGHLAVLDKEPLPEEPRLLTVFQLFADRASAELRRIRAESLVREREEKLTRLVDGAMDAIVELDGRLAVTHVNTAAEAIFRAPASRLVGGDFRRCLSSSEGSRLEDIVRELDCRNSGRAHTWIPGGLRARAADGFEFPAEATISRHRRAGRDYHTLILRNVNDRVAAEERIRSLSVEASYLREELRAQGDYGEILGKSDALMAMLHEVEQVAGTDASVLILGETGTGKELVARALHSRGRRKDKPLVRVNCAAIPDELVESELFGHEKGAFTGATAKREGRFELADGGTIFLDELGELPIGVQVKLLRVLQEGEFEPVGSSRTRKVDVRVLSATSRDLAAMMRAGTFREDLYYRLSVFPIHVPSLRQRGEDVVLLAEAFARKFARRMGRDVLPLTESDKRKLLEYDWPGNVRELANVIERAVITAREGRLDLDRALAVSASGTQAQSDADDSSRRIRTVEELAALERENILRALEAAQWRVAGEGGAAALLGMKASTLASRMKALGVSRPGE
jgi:PAS domain S-box-containing protein